MGVLVTALWAMWLSLSSIAVGATDRPVYNPDVCQYKLHKLSVLREIDALLKERPGDPLEARRTARFATHALRSLVDFDDVSVGTLEKLRDALKREAFPVQALGGLAEWRLIATVAGMHNLRQTDPKLVLHGTAPNPHGPTVIAALGAGGEHLFLGSRRALEIFNAKDGRRLHALDGDLAGAQAATFAPTGDHVFVTFRGRVGFVSWSASDGEKQLSALQERALAATSAPRNVTAEDIALSPDAKQLVTASPEDPRLFFWDLSERRGRWVKLPDGTLSGVADVKWSRDGRYVFALGSTPRHVYRFDVTGNSVDRAAELPVGDINAIAVHDAEGSLVALGESRGRVVLWDAKSGRVTRDFATGITENAVLSSDGRFVAGTRRAGNTVRLEIWSVRHASLVHAEPLREGTPHLVLFSADNRFVSVGLSQGATHTVQTYRLDGFDLE